MMVYNSLDGKGVYLDPTNDSDAYKLQTLLLRATNGYHNVVPLRGEPGLTELCMHTRCAHKNGIVAFVNDSGTYAYVLFEDKSIVDGSFIQFENGSWNIS